MSAPLKEDIAPRDGLRRRAERSFVPSVMEIRTFLTYETDQIELKSVKWSAWTT
jgi:hypothetical protein